MPDREKVIKAIEEAFDLVHSDFIGTDDFNETEWEQNKADALELLKEQEAVEPKKGNTPEESAFDCGNCGYPLWEDELYCAHCGRPVKWE